MSGTTTTQSNAPPWTEELLRDLSHDQRLGVLTQCVEAHAEQGRWALAVAYANQARNDAELAADDDLACACETTMGGWFYEADKAIAWERFDRVAARLAGRDPVAFVRDYPSRFARRGRQREFVAHTHAARLCLHMNRRDLAEGVLRAMREQYGKSIGIEEESRMFLWAMVVGREAAVETIAARVRICARCGYSEERGGTTVCALAGLKVAGAGFRRTDLTTYHERLPDWGCRHPRRDRGQGWPMEPRA